MFHPQLACFHQKSFTKIFSLAVVSIFTVQSVFPSSLSAQSIAQLNLPKPGTMIGETNAFAPLMLRGLTIDPENPLQMDFIVNTGDTVLAGEDLENESLQLVRYFLAALTTPENELWVNLSPYEKNRIIPQTFGETEMGRDLLAQDYVLKQLTASLMYPEGELGKKFWDKVYEKAYASGISYLASGESQSPNANDQMQNAIDSFNKVWIVPAKAKVYEHNGSVFVVESSLKVMLEEDYLASGKAVSDKAVEQTQNNNSSTLALYHSTTQDIIRSVILPAIEHEVNHGEHFAKLRQIFNALILSYWYKQNLKNTLLSQIYVDQGKTQGVDVEDKEITLRIYDEYLQAFKTGAYDMIREDYDPVQNEIVARKYFSGGANWTNLAMLGAFEKVSAPTANMGSLAGSGNMRIRFGFGTQPGSNQGMLSDEAIREIIFEVLATEMMSSMSSTKHGLNKAPGYSFVLWRKEKGAFHKGLSVLWEDSEETFHKNSARVQEHYEDIQQYLLDKSSVWHLTSDYRDYQQFFIKEDDFYKEFFGDSAMLALQDNLEEMFEDAEIRAFIQNILVGENGYKGLLRPETLKKLEKGSPAEIPTEIQNVLKRIDVRSTQLFYRSVIDGSVSEDDSGRYTFHATSVANRNNLDLGAGFSTSFEILEETENGAKPKAVVWIQWGSDIRIMISNGERNVDYDENLERIDPAKDNVMPDQKQGDDTIVSEGGLSKERPALMQAFEREVLHQKGIKGRHSDDFVVDIYLPIKKTNGFAGMWVTWGQLLGVHAMVNGANGRVMVETEDGLKNVSDINISMDKVKGSERVYVYAGSKDLTGELETFAKRNKGLVKVTQAPLEQEPRLQIGDLGEDLMDILRGNSEALVSGLRLDSEGKNKVAKEVINAVGAFQNSYVEPVELEGLASLEDSELERLGARRQFVDALIFIQDKMNEKKNTGLRFIYEESGKVYLAGSRDISRQLKVRVGEDITGLLKGSKYEKQAGDKQIALDFIYNHYKNFIAATHISTLIISSEEEDDLLYIGPDALNKDAVRIIFFNDPVDGSDLAKTGGVFVSLFQFVILHPGETIRNPNIRQNSVIEIVMQHHRLKPVMVVGFDKQVTKFVLDVDEATGKRAFRKHFDVPSILEYELNNFQWDGFEPMPKKGASLITALGGAPLEQSAKKPEMAIYSLLELAEIAKDGTRSAYSGSAGVDFLMIVLSLSAHARGRVYEYLDPKLRQLYEGTVFGKMIERLGGDGFNGQSHMLNFSFSDDMTGHQMNSKKIPFVFGSAWRARKFLAASQYLKEKGISADKVDDSVRKEFDDLYFQKTRELVNNLKKRSRKSEIEILRAVFTWFERPGMMWWKLINSPTAIVYDQIFNSEDILRFPFWSSDRKKHFVDVPIVGLDGSENISNKDIRSLMIWLMTLHQLPEWMGDDLIVVTDIQGTDQRRTNVYRLEIEGSRSSVWYFDRTALLRQNAVYRSNVLVGQGRSKFIDGPDNQHTVTPLDFTNDNGSHHRDFQVKINGVSSVFGLDKEALRNGFFVTRQGKNNVKESRRKIQSQINAIVAIGAALQMQWTQNTIVEIVENGEEASVFSSGLFQRLVIPRTLLGIEESSSAGQRPVDERVESVGAREPTNSAMMGTSGNSNVEERSFLSKAGKVIKVTVHTFTNLVAWVLVKKDHKTKDFYADGDDVAGQLRASNTFKEFKKRIGTDSAMMAHPSEEEQLEYIESFLRGRLEQNQTELALSGTDVTGLLQGLRLNAEDFGALDDLMEEAGWNWKNIQAFDLTLMKLDPGLGLLRIYQKTESETIDAERMYIFKSEGKTTIIKIASIPGIDLKRVYVNGVLGMQGPSEKVEQLLSEEFGLQLPPEGTINNAMMGEKKKPPVVYETFDGRTFGKVTLEPGDDDGKTTTVVNYPYGRVLDHGESDKMKRKVIESVFEKTQERHSNDAMLNRQHIMAVLVGLFIILNSSDLYAQLPQIQQVPWVWQVPQAPRPIPKALIRKWDNATDKEAILAEMFHYLEYPAANLIKRVIQVDSRSFDDRFFKEYTYFLMTSEVPSGLKQHEPELWENLTITQLTALMENLGFHVVVINHDVGPPSIYIGIDQNLNRYNAKINGDRASILWDANNFVVLAMGNILFLVFPGALPGVDGAMMGRYLRITKKNEFEATRTEVTSTGRIKIINENDGSKKTKWPSKAWSWLAKRLNFNDSKSVQNAMLVGNVLLAVHYHKHTIRIPPKKPGEEEVKKPSTKIIKPKPGPASLNPNNTGGIDLNPALFESFDVQKDDSGMLTEINGTPISEIRSNIQGLHPFIINITPLTNGAMLKLLGLNTQGDDPADHADKPGYADQKFLASKES